MPFLVTLHLRLNSPSGYVYRPGDLVSGAVWLRSDVDEDVKSVSIVLKGWTSVKFTDLRGPGGPRKFHEDYHLFVIPRVLFQGPKKFKKFEVHEWPFEFIFPAVSELDFEGEQMGEGAERFELNPHQLPPSLPFDQPYNGGIIYELEATMLNSGKDEKTRSKAETLLFRPPVDGITESGLVERRERKFKSKRMPPQSTKQKVRGLFAWDESNRPLSTSFTLHVDVPHDIHLGQLVPVSIQIQHNQDESTLMEVPSFFLHTAKIFLITVTATRLLNLEKVPKGHRFKEVKQSKLLDCGYDMMRKLNINTSMDLRRILKPKIGDELLPFRSYSIARSHRLKIMLIVKCDGDRTEFPMEVEVPISLLPSLTLDPSSGELVSISTRDGGSRRPSEQLLLVQSGPPPEGAQEELPGYEP
jgi:hypothetical protein